MGLDGAAAAQLRKGVIEFCVLALLEDDERYGFDLARALGGANGLATSEGTIYPLLARLHREGLIAATWRESEAGPPRKYFSITTKGVAALREFRADWQKFSRVVDQVLSKGSSQ